MYLRRKIAILWSFLLSALEGNIVFPTLFFLSGCALHAWLHTLFQQYFELGAERQHVFWEERFYSFDNIGIITHTDTLSNQINQQMNPFGCFIAALIMGEIVLYYEN